MTTTRIIVSCGARAGDIRQKLTRAGSYCEFRKILPGEAEGSYGEYLFEVSTADAVMIGLRYRGFVRAAR